MCLSKEMNNPLVKYDNYSGPLSKMTGMNKGGTGGGTHLSVNVKDLKPQVSCILALSLKKGIFRMES